MKAKLEAIANVTVIVIALAVGGVVLTRYAVSYRAQRWVAVGDHLAKLPGLDWSQHRRTLVLVPWSAVAGLESGQTGPCPAPRGPARKHICALEPPEG